MPLLILLTGEAGNTGSQVVKQLIVKGASTHALVRDSNGAASIKGSGIDIIVGDFSQPETLAQVLAAVERVFLLSPPSPQSEDDN